LKILEIKRSSDFDEAINRVLGELKEADLGSEEYMDRLSHLERLSRLRNEQQNHRVSPDTMAIIATNLLGILIIVGYEQGHVMASKSLGFVLRPK
jgi:hypothetical protein